MSSVENKPEVRGRRNLDRLKVNYPVIYARYDDRGEPCNRVIAKLLDLSPNGVRLQSGFPVDLGERLDISLALGDNLVSFKGKAMHVTVSKIHGFELGISIEDIEDEQRETLVQFLRWIRSLRKA